MAARPRSCGPKRTVTNPKAVKIFVDTTVSGDITTLPTQSQRNLAVLIRQELAYRGLRPICQVCRLMSTLAKSDWEGINWMTLRDNYYRQPGTRKR